MPQIARTLRIVSQPILLGNLREDLLQQKPRILVADRVVFDTAIGSRLFTMTAGRKRARIDEDSDRDRHLALVNQIVEDDRNTKLAMLIDVTSAVLKHHHAGGRFPIVLCGDVNPVIADRAWIDFLALPVSLSDGSLGDTGLPFESGPSL